MNAVATKTETRITDWHQCENGPWYPSHPSGGFLAYRIRQQFDGRRWFQQHEWKTVHGARLVDGWVDGAAGWAPSAKAEA